MARNNMVLYMENELELSQLKDILSKFDANNQESCWVVEKSDSCIWITYRYVKENNETTQIWAAISEENLEKTGDKEMKSVLFIQPSRANGAVFLALSFCQAVYAVIKENYNVFLYHENSGLFANDEISNLKFKNSEQFYDARLTNLEVVDDIIKSLEGEFLSAIETVVEDGGWDGDEIEYTDLFKNLFLMREQLDSDMINSSIEVRQQLNLVDELILELLTVDEEELLIKAGEEYRGEPITSWWWHLDKVKRKELVVSVGEGLLRYQDDIIKL